jgi:hypothetical protein
MRLSTLLGLGAAAVANVDDSRFVLYYDQSVPSAPSLKPD